MYRTFVILRHTFVESIVQPIYPLLLTLGGAILCIFGLLPFFTRPISMAFATVTIFTLLLYVPAFKAAVQYATGGAGALLRSAFRRRPRREDIT